MKQNEYEALIAQNTEKIQKKEALRRVARLPAFFDSDAIRCSRGKYGRLRLPAVPVSA